MKGINKQVVKSGLEVAGSALSMICTRYNRARTVLKTRQSLRLQRSEALMRANWCCVPGLRSSSPHCWAAQPLQELWLYSTLIAMKWKWPDNLTSLVSLRGIFIFNCLQWSFKPWSILYFRWHLSALTDIFFIFLISRLHKNILSRQLSKYFCLCG